MPAQIRYVYPGAVGLKSRNPATDKHQAKRIMSTAYGYAQTRGWVYRCRSEEGFVVIRRVA